MDEEPRRDEAADPCKRARDGARERERRGASGAEQRARPRELRASCEAETGWRRRTGQDRGVGAGDGARARARAASGVRPSAGVASPRRLAGAADAPYRTLRRAPCSTRRRPPRAESSAHLAGTLPLSRLPAPGAVAASAAHISSHPSARRTSSRSAVKRSRIRRRGALRSDVSGGRRRTLRDAARALRGDVAAWPCRPLQTPILRPRRTSTRTHTVLLPPASDAPDFCCGSLPLMELTVPSQRHCRPLGRAPDADGAAGRCVPCWPRAQHAWQSVPALSSKYTLAARRGLAGASVLRLVASHCQHIQPAASPLPSQSSSERRRAPQTLTRLLSLYVRLAECGEALGLVGL